MAPKLMQADLMDRSAKKKEGNIAGFAKKESLATVASRSCHVHPAAPKRTDATLK
jgi:hypothetical protein